jgi:hypothetical protein
MNYFFERNEKIKTIKTMANINKQGQSTLDDPLLTNQNSRVEVIVLIPKNNDFDEPSKAEILADFRQAWHEAMAGQTILLSQLWDFLAKLVNVRTQKD